MSAVRRVVKEKGGYRLVFRAGLVWLVHPDGSLVCVSSWRTCCPAHMSLAAQALGAVTVADDLARRTG